ncbi:MAG: DUF4910 domain-containing protein [Candidatus Methanomethylicia archaeon]
MNNMMKNINEILEEEYSIQELMEFLTKLSYYHRIQGSDGIEEAGEYIKTALIERSGRNIELKRYSYSVPYGSYDPVTGWKVKDGELRLIKPKEELLHTFKNSRTLVMAHSPGGVVEAEVVHVGNGVDPSNYDKIDVKGKIVLAYGYGGIVYRNAELKGACGLLVYRRSGTEDSVPYMGLFLTPEEAKEARIPAVTVSRATANRLIQLIERGEKPVVRISVEAEYRSEAWIPVVTMSIGSGSGEIHLTAHYCHPAGTVNDNVSGSAALMELALTFNRAIEKKLIEEPDKHIIKFIWIPEYAGSLAYMLNEKPTVVFNINLDMIGEKQELTGSTINFVRSPPKIYHPYEAVAYYTFRRALSLSEEIGSHRRALSYKFDLTPYQTGSDHDVYIQLEIPAIMILQWPDLYYHSDQDTVDKFDPKIAKRIAVAAGETAYKIAKRGFEDEIKIYAKAYFHEYIANEMIYTNKEYLDERYRYLIKTIGEKTLQIVKDEYLEKLLREIELKGEEMVEGEKYVYKGPVGILSTRRIYRAIGWNKYIELEKQFERMPLLSRIMGTVIPLYMRKPMSINELQKTILMEFGVKIEKENLETILKILEEAKIVEKLNK